MDTHTKELIAIGAAGQWDKEATALLGPEGADPSASEP
jgi:hypothetical protein